MIQEFRARLLPSSIACLLATMFAGGCGHAVEPRAPYQSSSTLPVPGNLKTSMTIGGDVLLNWSASVGDRTVVDGWLIERRFSIESEFAPIGPALVRDTTFLDNTIGDGQRAAYRVRSVTGAGLKSEPAESNLIRSDRFGPSPPTSLTVTALSAALRISFVASPEPDVNVYQVRLDVLDGSSPTVSGVTVTSPFTATGLTPGIGYGVSVTAVDSAGRVSVSSDVPVVGIPNP